MTGGQALIVAVIVALYGFAFALARISSISDERARASHEALLRELRRRSERAHPSNYCDRRSRRDV